MSIPPADCRLLKWFSVKDKLPDDEIAVLVLTVSGSMFMAYHENGRWGTDYGLEFAEGCVTHWADPEPPETED